jgi:Sap, sulfolipid-1-addressing protein
MQSCDHTSDQEESGVGQVIGQILSPAVGVALSPVPIIAVILMLVTLRGRVSGPAFLAGWLIGLAIVGTIVLLLARPAGPSSGGKAATWVSLLKLMLGALLVLLALRRLRGRPRGEDEPAVPKWMGAMERFGPAKAAAAGAVMTGANPKNTILAVTAAASIAAAGIGGANQAVAYAVFAVIGSVGVAAPVVVYFAMGDRAEPLLERMKHWMAQNNSVIMAVLLLVLGIKNLGDAISGLSG